MANATPMDDSAPVNILIVDDLPENQLVYRSILEGLGQNLMTARSGEEALKLVLKHDFAVILLDINMPGMNGFEVASLIQKRRKSAGTPIIFLTAFTDDVQIAQGYASGAVDFLPTPVIPEVLQAKVRVFIELLQMRRQAAIQAEERAKREAAEEAARHKDEFLATLAHELRNPLAPLSNALDMLQMPDINADTASSRYAEAVDIMRRQIQQMVRLVDDLLDVSRISHGKIELRKEHISLQQIIANALEIANPLIATGKHALSVELGDAPLWLNGDLTRLSQVFVNLLNNAAKYTPSEGRIWLTAFKEEGNVVIQVRDTGIGIPAPMLPRVFEMFTQVDNSIEKSYGGLGIGLTLVQRLVQLHGGSIEARSKGVNQGSEFIVRLPLAAAPQQEDSSTTSSSQPQNDQQENAARKFRVLVIDDNIPSAKTLGWMVEMLGHEVHLAHDGTNGFDTAKSFLPDVILLDIGLPGMSGYDVCRQMRAEPALKNSVLVAQTGWGQQEHRQLSKEAGFNHHFIKPVGIATLNELFSSLGRIG